MHRFKRDGAHSALSLVKRSQLCSLAMTRLQLIGKNVTINKLLKVVLSHGHNLDTRHKVSVAHLDGSSTSYLKGTYAND